ncbi:MAG: histidinol-phosphate aminotransferase family protein [Saprospiraceae bacterium]|nr:histidinol-phosphate aminotransferase family protein [Saprospiraceae bacterium]
MQRRFWLKRSALGTAALLSFPTTYWANNSDFTVKNEEIRLNANENPYGPSKRVRKALQSRSPLGNRYPWALKQKLKDKLAHRFDLSPDWFFLGAGSAELLGLLGLYYGSQSGTVISPAPIFPLLPQYMARHGGDWRQVQMAANGEISLSAIDQTIDSKTQLLYICNPNNPTGWTFPSKLLKEYCQAVPKQIDICVDEAYIEYTKDDESASVAELVERHPNLIICRTFSKIYGLAGMRVGYMIAHPDKIKKYKDYHTGFELTASAHALQAAIVALDDQEFVEESRRKNREALADMIKVCTKLQLPYIPSQANHLAFNPTALAVPFFDRMAEASIRLGRFQYQGEDWCRLTMGTKTEMRVFQEKLQGLLG